MKSLHVFSVLFLMLGVAQAQSTQVRTLQSGAVFDKAVYNVSVVYSGKFLSVAPDKKGPLSLLRIMPSPQIRGMQILAIPLPYAEVTAITRQRSLVGNEYVTINSKCKNGVKVLRIIGNDSGVLAGDCHLVSISVRDVVKTPPPPPPPPTQQPPAVQPPAPPIPKPVNCTFNGRTVWHKSVVVAYKAESVTYPARCEMEVRRCENGVLSGSFAATSCRTVVAPPKPPEPPATQPPSPPEPPKKIPNYLL